MYILRSIATAIVCACLAVPSRAHSNERNPLKYLSVVDNVVLKTPSNRVHALSSFELNFELHGGNQKVRLTLTPNHDVLADGATVQTLAKDGSIQSSELIDRSDYRVFKGQAWLKHFKGSEWTNVGWARILVHQDGKRPLFEGAFRMDGDHHHVQTNTHYMQTKHALDPVLAPSEEDYMVVWRDSDISTDATGDDEPVHGELKRSLGDAPSCSADGLTFNTQPEHPVFRAMLKREDRIWGSASMPSLFGRQIDGQTGGKGAGVNLQASIGSSAGCPSTRKVALVGIATDCNYGASFNTTEFMRRNIIAMVNAASVVYEDSFNITLGLRNLTITENACPATASADVPWNVPCSTSVDIQRRLNLFSDWRGRAPRTEDNNAYWTLLSTCATDSAVGLAWLGQVCIATSQVASSSAGNETVSGANVVVKTGTEWQVFAHETGHTFGAVHDCNTATCADGKTVASQQCCPLDASTCDAGARFIMNPSTGPNIKAFSPCSIGNICSAIGRNSVKTTCLSANKDVTTITGSQCGNGIVESGEDCDCGGEDSCKDNACCDATTCKFKQNAVCDPSNEDCCSSTCQFAGNGTVCRTSTGVCDPQETCSGLSSTCPQDETAPDGTSCGSSLQCSSGQCTSRDLQCKTLMGSYTTGNDTYACEANDCQVSCASPEFGANVCYSMQQNFLDGTACGGGGKCNNGQCKGSTVGKEIQKFITKNKKLVIILCSVIGGLLILSILGCIISRCRRNRRIKKRIANRPVGPPPGWAGANTRGGGPPPGIPQQYAQAPPYVQPQMAHIRGSAPGVQERWRQVPQAPAPWQPSVRYA